MGEHKSPDVLKNEIEEGKKQVPIGSLWGHFKNPDKYYEIVDLVIMEETDEVGVAYRSTFEPTKGITFVKSLEGFLSEKELEDGTKVKRFTKAS